MNIAYPLIPVTVITILAYFTTWMFSKWEIFSFQWHRKFWNYLLLITFLISGILGLMSVIKVNYKLEIPKYDVYMQWHVSFGIAMVFVAFFHLSWHLKYYFTFDKKTASTKGKKSTPIIDSLSENFKWLLFLLGLVSIISQVVFIREFISILSGNELIIGIILASWMLLTGWGAFSARKNNFSKLSFKRGIIMLAALTLMPAFLIGLLYWMKNLMFPPGTIMDIGISAITAFLFLFPVCFLSGYLFTAFSTVFSESKKTNLIGKSYSFESLGSLFGGFIFSIVLGRFFNSFQIFGIVTAFVFFTGVLFIWKKSHRLLWSFLIPGIFIPVLIFIFNPDTFIKKMLFPNQELVANHSTRYGNLVVTKQAGQINVYENNDLQFYTENVMMNEEAVHFAMVQHKNPKQILLISGGISGMIKEIEKYDVEKITYLETNPEIFKTLKKHIGSFPENGNVEIIKSDIRYFIGKTDHKYDVVLLNLPPPSSLGMNRFYTEEFFQLLKKHCNTETVIRTSLPSTANYAEENALEVNSSLWKTLGIHFQHQLLMPGEKNYFLASDNPLHSNITEKITNQNIETTYVNQYYLNDNLLQMRSESVTGQFNTSVPVNRDFSPYMFVRQIWHWLSYFGTGYKILIIVPVLLFLLIFLKTDKITAGLYTGGFTAASLEVALLLAYQVYFGSIYLATALFFAVFMAGLALGSSAKIILILRPIKSYYLLQFGLGLFAVALPFIIQFTELISAWKILTQIFYFMVIFILATGIGQEFLLASEIQQKKYSETSGINYGTDLAGSAFGAFLTAIVLLPILGLFYTCFIVAALNIFSGLLAFSARTKSIF